MTICGLRSKLCYGAQSEAVAAKLQLACMTVLRVHVFICVSDSNYHSVRC
jgi:hypothetical protein